METADIFAAGERATKRLRKALEENREDIIDYAVAWCARHPRLCPKVIKILQAYNRIGGAIVRGLTRLLEWGDKKATKRLQERATTDEEREVIEKLERPERIALALAPMVHQIKAFFAGILLIVKGIRSITRWTLNKEVVV